MECLLLIDIQQGLDDLDYYGGERNNPNAEAVASDLLNAFRIAGLPVIHVQHASQNPDSPLHHTKKGHAIKALVAPKGAEKLIIKHSSSAFMATPLHDILRTFNCSTLVVAGLTTEHCVSSTVRAAADLGYSTVVVSDATASFCKHTKTGLITAETIYRASLANLEGEFARISTSPELLSSLGLR